MLLNKSTAKILNVFTGRITESFTLREIARISKMHVSLAHRATKPLIEANIVQQDRHKHLILNYKKNHETLAFVEYLKRDNLLNKPRYSNIKLFADEAVSKIKEEGFILVLFGSAVNSNKPRDIDILLIVDNASKVEFHEKFLYNIASNYKLPFETRVISFESVYEMLSKRDEANILNGILNKHIILYGAELFYRLIGKGRR